MTLGQFNAALEAWRTGDRATLKRVMEQARAERHQQEYELATLARQEFDIELIRKPNGNYEL